MVYKSGDCYEGDWHENIRHGKGVMKWKNRNEEYSGEWKEGLPHGSGTYTWAIKPMHMSQFPMSNQYRGDWFKGKRQGFGIFYYASGAIYKGEWNQNQKVCMRKNSISAWNRYLHY